MTLHDQGSKNVFPSIFFKWCCSRHNGLSNIIFMHIFAGGSLTHKDPCLSFHKREELWLWREDQKTIIS